MPNKFLWFIASVINIFITTFEELVHVISELIYFYCAGNVCYYNFYVFITSKYLNRYVIAPIFIYY